MIEAQLQSGQPVRDKLLPYGQHWIDDDDIQAVVEALSSPWITRGPRVEEFEKRFAEVVGSKYAVALSSGTAALHAAIHAARIGAGDEVLTSPLTFAASANCILYVRAVPVFADVDPRTLNIDPEQIARRITPRTKAILPVHFTGLPCDMDEIHEIARRHNLAVVEDAAHALGTRYRGRAVGSISQITAFSLHPVKHITTGEGGVATTHDPELDRRLRVFRNHGIWSDARRRQEDGAWFYEVVDLGYNYHITDVQCALGLSQLRKLERFTKRRAEIANHYNTAFAELPELELPAVQEDRSHGWHIYVIRLNLARLRADRNAVFAALRGEGIGVNVHYIPVYLHPYYQKLGYERGLCPIAEKAYESLLTLPLFPKMSDKDVDDVICAVRKVISRFRS